MRKNAKLPKTLGKKIQQERKRQRLTQEQLAERAKISRAYMGYIEQGRNVPSLDVIQKIANSLKTPISDLFGN